MKSNKHSGFTFIEALIGTALVTTALFQVSVLQSEADAVNKALTRAETLNTMNRFVRRLAAEDFRQLYGRLHALQREAAAENRSELVRSRDERLHPLPVGLGRSAWHPKTYVKGFANTMGFGVLIDVPVNPDPEASELLAEDLHLPQFGLPADLNGDGGVDSFSRESDYLKLPLRVHFVWTHPEQGPQQLTMTRWLVATR